MPIFTCVDFTLSTLSTLLTLSTLSTLQTLSKLSALSILSKFPQLSQHCQHCKEDNRSSPSTSPTCRSLRDPPAPWSHSWRWHIGEHEKGHQSPDKGRQKSRLSTKVTGHKKRTWFWRGIWSQQRERRPQGWDRGGEVEDRGRQEEQDLCETPT